MSTKIVHARTGAAIKKPDARTKPICFNGILFRGRSPTLTVTAASSSDGPTESTGLWTRVREKRTKGSLYSVFQARLSVGLSRRIIAWLEEAVMPNHPRLVAHCLLIAEGTATPTTLTRNGLTVLLTRRPQAQGHNDGKPTYMHVAVRCNENNNWLGCITGKLHMCPRSIAPHSEFSYRYIGSSPTENARSGLLSIDSLCPSALPRDAVSDSRRHSTVAENVASASLEGLVRVGTTNTVYNSLQRDATQGIVLPGTGVNWSQSRMRPPTQGISFPLLRSLNVGGVRGERYTIGSAPLAHRC